jgi:GT2 family glycosyltransferase
MRLSVVIPTHDRPDLVHDCLLTVGLQEANHERLEVVVVDDGSSCDIASVVDGVSSSSPMPFRCERQPLSGLNAARNRGASVTTGEVIAFLDDDTLLVPGWASALLAAFDREPCAAAGGRVELGLAGIEPPWMTEWRCYLAEYDLGSEARWLEPSDPVPVGANCAVRRTDFERLGGFREGLDRLGASLVSNGDTEFFRRLRSAGGRLLYVPEATVVHRVPAERMTVDYFRRRHRAQGVSDELLLRVEGHRASWGHRIGLSREVLRSATSLAAERLRGGSQVRDRLLLSYWMGRLAATRIGGASPAGEPSLR